MKKIETVFHLGEEERQDFINRLRQNGFTVRDKRSPNEIYHDSVGNRRNGDLETNLQQPQLGTFDSAGYRLKAYEFENNPLIRFIVAYRVKQRDLERERSNPATFRF